MDTVEASTPEGVPPAWGVGAAMPASLVATRAKRHGAAWNASRCAPRVARVARKWQHAGMAARKVAKKATKKKAVGQRKRRGVALTPTELTATELALDAPPAELAPVLDRVRADGGAVLATYREPLAGRTLVLVSLPIERVKPTPFQRDVSDAHVRKLTRAMDKTRRFLDP